MTDLDPREIARDRNWPCWLADLGQEWDAQEDDADNGDRDD